jgi:nucleotide-binding universal stress UspA family protein
MSGEGTPLGVVVGVDGSPSSDAAVRFAANEAATRHVPLSVRAVVAPLVHSGGPWPEVVIPDEQLRSQRAEAQQHVDRALGIAADAGGPGVPVTGEAILGPVVATLVGMSDQADMVVVGCHGQSAVSRALLGSVSSGVVHHARCPVAVIHHEQSRPPDAPVVVGVDGSPTSELATAIAFDEASRRGVDLVAVHAWSDMGPIDFASANWAPIEWRNIKVEAEELLSERLSGYCQRYPDVSVRQVVVCDLPARRLLEQAEKAQLLVLGSHGRGGVPGMLLGSVSTAVVHSAGIPVIIARR